MTDTIWEFTPGTNTWVHKSAHLPVPLGYIPTAVIFNLIYTGGGSTWDGSMIHDSNYSFVYDPINDSISSIASIPRATGETRAIPFAPIGGTDYQVVYKDRLTDANWTPLGSTVAGDGTVKSVSYPMTSQRFYAVITL